jgi:hypothetical protein
MAGMLSAATWRGATFGEKDEKSAERAVAMRKAAVKRRARRFTTRELVWFAAGFLGARLRQAGAALRKLLPGR